MASVASTFKTHEPSLPELLDEIHKGTVQLPDFQRGWVWDDDRIRASSQACRSLIQSAP